ncbi:MFS transporter [Streptomyces griseoruber]|uniref:MFS transporter n=1 Tax=Streptomyces griseoruber TaxID=1943 RepID=UPI0037BA3419
MTTQVQVAPAADQGSSRSRWVIVSIAFASLLGTLMQSLIVPLVPKLPAELHADPSVTSWLVTAMLLSGTISSVLFGRLGDQFGKRRMMLIALSSMLAGSVIGSLTDSVWWLILARVLQGVAMAMIPLGISALRDVMRGDQLFKGIALISAMAGIGGSLGFAMSALAAQFFGLRGLFIGSAVLGAIALAGVIAFIPKGRVERQGRLDVFGAVVLTVGLVGLLVGITEGNAWGWTSPAVLGLLAASAVVLVLWGVHQLRVSEPLIDLRAARSRPVLFTNLASLAVGFAMYGIILVLPQMVQLPTQTGYGLGRSVAVAGLAVAPGGIIALFLPNIAARISESRGPKTTMVIGALLITAGYVFLLIAHSRLWHFFVAPILISGGVSFAFGAAPAIILMNVPRHESGQANGINNLARSLGTAISAAITAAILTTMLIPAGFGVNRLPSETAFRFVMLGGITAALVAILLVSFVPRRSEQPASLN